MLPESSRKSRSPGAQELENPIGICANPRGKVDPWGTGETPLGILVTPREKNQASGSFPFGDGARARTFLTLIYSISGRGGK